jgi:hypothetical protein
VIKILSVGFAAAALALSGCGAAKPNDPPSARRTILEWDATGTTSRLPGYRTELKGEIVHVAAERGDLFAAVLDGQPVTTANIETHNFAQAPPEIEGDEVAEADEAFAEGFAHNFIASFASGETVSGSGQLQGLLLAAHTPDVAEVIVWTDGVVNEPSDGFDLSTASVAGLNAEIARWKPKLVGLHGVTVVLIGVGRGVHHVITVERAHRLFDALVGDNGGHLVWTPTLAQR